MEYTDLEKQSEHIHNVGEWLGSACWQIERHEHGEISTKLFPSAEGAQRRGDALFSPNAGDGPVPCTGQVRAHTLPGWLTGTNCCWEKRE